MHKKYNPCVGFTLTELMTVVLIVSLMAALGVGYYKKSIEQSHFGEGLSAASTIAEAVNRAYYDALAEGETLKQPKIKSLDVKIGGNSTARACTSASDYCVKTKYFQVSIAANGVTTAARENGNYSIVVYPHFEDTSMRDRIFCYGNNDNGKTFCESMGYTSCTGTNPSACLKQ